MFISVRAAIVKLQLNVVALISRNLLIKNGKDFAALICELLLKNNYMSVTPFISTTADTSLKYGLEIFLSD